MTDIFKNSSYRKYLDEWINSHGDRSYGLKGKIAKALGISSSLLSQILKGEKSLTPDQAADLADFMGLSDLESDFLHLLVELDRASNPRYKNKLTKKLESLQRQSQKVSQRIQKHSELTDEQKSIYYSSWVYTAVRNLTAIQKNNRADLIAQHLHLEPMTVQRVLRFLIENGLCIENESGLTYGPAHTHVDFDSPHVNRHHQNWRFVGIQMMEKKAENDLFFTSPMSLSEEAYVEIRKLLPQFIQQIAKISGPSDSETVACLNIDWFKY